MGLPGILPLSLIGVDVLVLGGQAQLPGQDGSLVHEGVHLVQGDLEPELHFSNFLKTFLA
jgi:hypothetical protein